MLNVEKQIDVTHPDFKDLYNEGYIYIMMIMICYGMLLRYKKVPML